MVAERQFSRQGYGKIFVFICAVTVVLSGTFLFAVEQRGASELARYRVFSLRHISAEQGKKYLAEAGISIVSQLPSPNTLLVTAQPRELIKASALLKLVDAEELFCIKAIFPSSEAKNLPSNKQIAAEVGKISIGTFSDPPPTLAKKTKAIIDIHNDAVTVVAPAEQLERIISAIKQLQEIKTQALRPAKPAKSIEPNQTNGPKPEEIMEAELEVPHFARAPKRDKRRLGTPKDSKMGPERIAAPDESQQVETDSGDYESDELFNKLLDSLAKAEKIAAEQAQKPSEPNEPSAQETVPSQKAPSKPPVAFKQTEETAFQASKQPQEPNLPAVIGLETKDAAGKPKLQPQPEPTPEQVAIETEQPSEVTEPVSRVRPYEPEPITNGDEMLELDLPEKLNIVDLLDLVGKYLNLDYMYDPTKVKGDVTLKLQGPIKVKDLYPLLESVLKFKGFVMTRKGNLVTIVPAAEALGIDPALLKADEGKVQYGDVIITRVFNLKYIDTASAQNLLTGMKLSANITPIAETGTLIITGYAYRMPRIEELLEMIDKPGEPKQFRFRQLKYTMAKTLAPKIKTLAEQLGTISIAIAAPAAPRPARGRKPAPRRPAPASKTAKPTVYLDADERTNRILMIGLVDQLVVVDKLIDALDVEQQDLRTLRLYEIQHVGAEEVKKKLEELGIIGAARPTRRAPTRAKAAKPRTTPTTTATAEALVEEPQVVIIESTNSLLVNATDEQHTQVAVIIGYVDSETLEQAIPYEIYSLENQSPEDLAEVLQKLIQETIKDKEGKIQQVIKREENIVIVPDKNTFSLIVYASRKNQEWIGSLVKTLDKRRPQVLIDVTLVEVTRTDLFDLDLQLATKWPKLQTDGIMEVASAVALPFVGGTAEIFSSPKTSTAEGFYSDAHIQALLTAMQTKSYGRVLAKPKILVNDGQAGTIKTTDTTNVKFEDVIRGGPDKEDQITVRFAPYSAGITLTITPNISEGDLLLLEVELTRSDFGDPPETGSPPDTTESNINTVVTVPNARTIILGGLVKLNQAKGGTKVPLLGDIPLLGGLFRSTKNSARDSKLYIFVKANILRPDETLTGLPELEKISDRNKAVFEEFEEKFQKLEDWPGIKPEPMDPLRVLEAE